MVVGGASEFAGACDDSEGPASVVPAVADEGAAGPGASAVDEPAADILLRFIGYGLFWLN